MSLNPVKQTSLLIEASITQKGIRHSFPQEIYFMLGERLITKEGPLLVILEETQLRSDP